MEHLELDRDKTEMGKGQLLETHPIENGPLMIVGNKEAGYFIALGRYRLTQPMETKIDCEIWMDNNQWKLVVLLIATLLEAETRGKEQENQIPESSTDPEQINLEN